MHEIIIGSFGYYIKIKSDINIVRLIKDSLVIRNFIPGLRIVSSRSKYFLVVEHKQLAKIRSYSEKKGKVIIEDDWSSGIPIYIVHLLYKLFSKAYLLNNAISLHSSAIEKNGVLYLLIGFSGAGKTSLLIKLLEDFGFKMISGNKILLKFENEKIFVAGATNVLSIRSESPTKLKKIKPLNSEEFCNRKVYDLPSKYFSKNKKFEKIYIISTRINSGVEEFYRMDTNDVLPIFYPMALDLVNREIIMFDGNLLVTDNVDLKTKRRIFQIVKKYKNISLIYHASGGLDYICQKINRIKL